MPSSKPKMSKIETLSITKMHTQTNCKISMILLLAANNQLLCCNSATNAMRSDYLTPPPRGAVKTRIVSLVTQTLEGKNFENLNV
jgi:hypothetical protein